MKKAQKNRIKLGMGILVIVALVVLYKYTPLSTYLQQEYLQNFIAQFGMFGPVVYGLAYIVLTVAFFPASLLTIMGGVIFGTLIGMFYTIIAATIAAAIAFYIAKFFGRGVVARLVKGTKLGDLDKKLEKGGFYTMALLRLLYIPYMPLSYAAGLSKMKAKDFVLATFLTNIPGSFAFSYLGGSLGDPRAFVFAVGLVVLVLLSPKLVKRFQKRKSS